MIPREIVEEVVSAILKSDRSYCDCRRSPFDGHDYNPPCATVIKVRKQVTLTLEIAAPHMKKIEPVAQKRVSVWGIFGVSSPVNSEPIIPPRFSSQEKAETYIKEQFPSPDFFQARERINNGWTA